MSAADERAGARARPPVDEDEVWIRDEEPARPATAPARRREKPLPPALKQELTRATGAAKAGKLHDRLAAAVKAYEHDRYPEARRILKALADEAPSAAAVRELLGLTHYRLGNWAAAVRELDAFHALTASYDQHPVLADCHRALGHHNRAMEVWDELRRASPGVELVSEGRIVAAGTLADRGDLEGAIELLRKARLDIKNPRLDHLRQWYALADLYERAGEVPRARDLFTRIERIEPGFFDVAQRLRALG